MPLDRETRPMHALKEDAPTLSRVKHGYTTGARTLASRSVTGLTRTRVTPNALTVSGVSLCLIAALIVPFENRNELLFYWLGAGDLRRRLGPRHPRRCARARRREVDGVRRLSRLDDRPVGEGAMLAAIALIFARNGNDTAVVFTIVGVAGSFLVPYVRAKAEALGLRGDVGLGSRAERVIVITAGLVLAPWGLLPWAIYLLAVTSWITVLQRVLHVRKQLISGGTNV